MTSTKKHVSVLGERDGASGRVDNWVALGKMDEDGDFDAEGDMLELGKGDGAADGVCVGMGCTQLAMLNEYASVIQLFTNCSSLKQ